MQLNHAVEARAWWWPTGVIVPGRARQLAVGFIRSGGGERPQASQRFEVRHFLGHEFSPNRRSGTKTLIGAL